MLRLRSPWLGLTPRFGWHRLRYVPDMEAGPAVLSNFTIPTSNFIRRFVPIANQTGFHATTAVKARRPCSRICSSLPFGQTSRQRVRFAADNFDPSACRCGGDRCDLFVSDNQVAT